MDTFLSKKKKFSRGSALIKFSFILALASCAASGYLFLQWSQLTAEKNNFEAVRAQLKDEISSLETDLQSALKEQQTLKQAVEIGSGEKEQALLALAEAKASAEQFEADIKKLKNERDSFKKIAVDLKSKTSQLAAAAASSAATGVSASSGELDGNTNEPSALMEIKTINRTFNFVVFDLVPGVPLRVGDAAVVERGGRWISDLKIKQVYAQFASAEIRKEDEGNLLQIGDFVKRL